MTVIVHDNAAPPASPGAPGFSAFIGAIVGTEGGRIAAQVRAADGSFFWASRLLPRRRRDALYALHAFCRELRDIADGEASRGLKLALLSDWRCEVARLFAGWPQRMVTRALAGPVRDYSLRCEDFLALIDGMEMEARRNIRAPSFAELDLYCSQVAASAGRIALRILGASTPAADQVAAELGRALQLTGILRDLAADARRDRLYLPRELLQAHGVFTTMPNAVLAHPALPRICRDLASLADAHYTAATAAMADCPRRGLRPAAVVLALHRGLLHRLLAQGWTRLENNLRTPPWRLAALALGQGLTGR
jgi:phytoene synthase